MRRDYIGYAIGLIGIVAGILSSYYFYEQSRQMREPVFVPDLFPSRVLNAEAAAKLPIKVVREDGTPITKDLFTASVVFWNRGTQPIKAEDILAPVTIELGDSAAELVLARLEKVSRQITGCSIELDKSPHANRAALGFKILEPQDGCIIQLSYLGTRESKFKIAGEFVGVRHITTISDAIDSYMPNTKWLLTSRLASQMIPFLAFALLLWRVVTKTTGWSDRKQIVIMGFTLAAYGALILWNQRITRNVIHIDVPLPQTSSWTSQ